MFTGTGRRRTWSAEDKARIPCKMRLTARDDGKPSIARGGMAYYVEWQGARGIVPRAAASVFKPIVCMIVEDEPMIAMTLKDAFKDAAQGGHTLRYMRRSP